MKYVIATLIPCVIATLIAIILFGSPFSTQLGSTVSNGIVPKVYSAATATAGPQVVLTVAAAKTGCVSRTLSTLGVPIMLSFSSDVTPSATAGHAQAASTTVTYENGSFGCGAITAFAFSSTTVTVTAFNQY